MGQAEQDVIEDAAHFSGGYHIGVQIIEHFGVLLQGFRKGRAGFDVLFDLFDDFGERFVRGLLSEDIESLHDRQAGVDHGGELAGEDHHVLGLDFLAEPRDFDLSI